MLTDTGDRIDTPEGTNARAVDSAGNTVIVSASHEAIQDHGWGAIFTAASQKYDRGDIVSGSKPPRARVTTADF